MSNVTDEQCEARTAGLHAKLDQILTNQSKHGERLAVVETKVAGNKGFLNHIVTVVTACITAFVVGLFKH